MSSLKRLQNMFGAWCFFCGRVPVERRMDNCRSCGRVQRAGGDQR